MFDASNPNGGGTHIPGAIPGTASYREPPTLDNDVIGNHSHMRRANDNRDDPTAMPPTKAVALSLRESFRIFRQSYPFLEPNPFHPNEFERESGFRPGLNFISFQNNPLRLISILTTKDTWLGATNFGGPEYNEPLAVNADTALHPVNILNAYAAGMFFVPPIVDGEPFPGAAALTATS
ncbi:MAG: hypothetical protein JO186_00265 [Actinobacteria bacterium]|nr:hypothetical protein [Actinomycetota bacterium]